MTLTSDAPIFWLPSIGLTTGSLTLPKKDSNSSLLTAFK